MMVKDPFPDADADVLVVVDSDGTKHLYERFGGLRPLCDRCRQLAEYGEPEHEPLADKHQHTPYDGWCDRCHANAHEQVRSWIGRGDAPLVDYSRMFPAE